MYNIFITVIFIITYLVMAMGEIPKTHFGRAEVALIAGVIVLSLGAIPFAHIPQALEIPTLIILLTLMLLSAILKTAHFYAYTATHIANYSGSSLMLLLIVIISVGLLSMFLANDIIAFAMTPVVAYGIQKRGLNPKPFLLALMAACNIGSAATIIGNPQNILIAQKGHLHFLDFFLVCSPVAIIGLFITFIVIAGLYRHDLSIKPNQEFSDLPDYNRGRSFIGFILIGLLIIAFLTPMPRASSALVILLITMLSFLSRSRSLIEQIDWRLLLLFIGLFLVNAAFDQTGIAHQGILWFQHHGLVLSDLKLLVPYSFILSNTIGNVPATIMTLSLWPPHSTETYYALALMMTFAGNALLFGSLANIIVAERAKSVDLKITFWEHLRSGLPISLITMGLAWVWLIMR